MTADILFRVPSAELEGWLSNLPDSTHPGGLLQFVYDSHEVKPDPREGSDKVNVLVKYAPAGD